MIHTMECIANITAQDVIYPTYKKIDCDLHTNDNDNNFYGSLIDCPVVVTTILIDAIEGSTIIDVEITIGVGDVDIDADTIAVTIDISTGTKIKFNSTGTLPAPLVTGNLYYAIRIDGTHIKVGTSLINANAGVAIDLTDVGVGIHSSTVYRISDGILQSLRLRVLIDNMDVSEALIGSFNIQHNKNKIGTFALNLGDTIYSPRINSHVDLEKEVIITAYINGQEKKLFTGLLDEPEAENTPEFKVMIVGRDYGKKLLDKKATLISIQNLATSSKRNDVIKYLAEQAGVTDVDIPEMDLVTIDNSFCHQSIWDMIQKEAMVELYWIGFSEDNVMQLKLDEIKSDESLYPTPDWSYNEDRFIRLGYKKPKIGINKITVLGQTKQERIPHTTTTVIPGDEPIIPGVGPTIPMANPTVTLFSDSLSYADGEEIFYNSRLNYTKTMGDFTLKIRSYGSWSAGGGNIHIHIECKMHKIWESYVITLKVGTVGGDATLIKTVGSSSGVCWFLARGKGSLVGWITNSLMGHKGGAFSFNIIVKGHLHSSAVASIVNVPIIEPTTTTTTTTYEIKYDQISALVTDPNSIEKYGERDGGSIEYPLLETVEQCIAVGKKIIRNSHKLGIGSIEIPFNPLIKTGQTIALNDTKIGLTERYYIEGIGHNGEIDKEGKIKVRTQVVGVHYA